jgi:nitroreductase
MRSAPLRFERLNPEEALRRLRAFLERMEPRRSVRMFSTDPVPRELIENAIRVAGTAPSGAHQQPWTFVVVSDRALKTQIREAAELEEREFYEHRATPEWLEALELLGTDWVKTHLTDAPYVVVVFEQVYGPGKRKHYYVREGDARTDAGRYPPAWTYWPRFASFSTACAAASRASGTRYGEQLT